jgi:putative oxidoreductase
MVIEELLGNDRKPTRKDVALLPPRAALAAAMLYHGTQKLRGSREEVTDTFEAAGLRPARFWSKLTGIAETAAGVLSVAGFLTRPAALAVLVTQAVAIAKVHAPRGFASTRGGFEYNLALIAMAAALLVAGPGRLSAHEALEHAVDSRGGRVLSRLRRVRTLRRFRRMRGLRRLFRFALAARLVRLVG